MKDNQQSDAPNPHPWHASCGLAIARLAGVAPRVGAGDGGRSLKKMTAIEKIENRLRKYPSAKYSLVGDTITVEALDDDGFSVWLTEKKPGYTVGYDGWHEEFDEEEDALSAFAFGLSDDCRLKVVRRGNSEYAWIVEGKNDDGSWSGDSTTGLLLTPFWRKKSIVYRQNRLITNSQQDAPSNGGERSNLNSGFPPRSG